MKKVVSLNINARDTTEKMPVPYGDGRCPELLLKYASQIVFLIEL